MQVYFCRSEEVAGCYSPAVLPWQRTSVGLWVLSRSVLQIKGLLHRLPIPSRPWSNIALDFVTGLPLSSGNTVILTVVDCFSKAIHFIALSKLPSAKETARVVIDHVFQIHGLPEDVVSDRRLQFVSHFWREFCRQIGASTSLSSGFYPQTNGQS